MKGKVRVNVFVRMTSNLGYVPASACPCSCKSLESLRDSNLSGACVHCTHHKNCERKSTEMHVGVTFFSMTAYIFFRVTNGTKRNNPLSRWILDAIGTRTRSKHLLLPRNLVVPGSGRQKRSTFPGAFVMQRYGRRGK